MIACSAVFTLQGRARVRTIFLLSTAALLFGSQLLATNACHAQVVPGATTPRDPATLPETKAPTPAPAKQTSNLKSHPRSAPAPAPGEVDLAAAYYHDSLAHLYESMAVNNGRPDLATQAIEEYKLALNADPSSAYLTDGLADLYFRLGRIREAVGSAQDQIKKNPKDVAAHTLLGKVYLRSLGDGQGTQSTEILQLAIGEYETLAKLEPKNVETHLLLGQLYGLNHDSAKAEAQFKLAQSLDGNSEEVALNMARLYSEEGQPQRAVDVLNAVPADDRGGRLNFALGASYDELKQPKQAAAAYRASLDDEPDNPDTLHALGTDLIADDQLPAALEVYQHLVKLDPTDVPSNIKVAEILRRQGHFNEALAVLEKARTMNGASDNLELAYNEAALYEATGKFDQAEAALKAILTQTAKPDGSYTASDRSNRAIFLDRLAAVQNDQTKTADAVATYKQMIALGGPEYQLRGYQGEVETYKQAQQYKEAVAAAAEAAQAMPKSQGAQMMYAAQLADAGQPALGIAIAEKALAAAPTKGDQRDAEINIGNMEYRQHHSAEAIRHLNKADELASSPDEHSLIDLLRAQIYDHDKQYDLAETQYRAALKIDPANATVLNDLGYMLADRGVRLDEALKMIQQAVALDPVNGAYLDSLGWIYFKLGQYGPAEENLQKAIARTPSDASIHEHLGEVYEKTGRLKLAVSQWERAMGEYAHALPADADPADVAKLKRELDDARTKLARNGGASVKKS